MASLSSIVGTAVKKVNITCHWGYNVKSCLNTLWLLHREEIGTKYKEKGYHAH